MKTMLSGLSKEREGFFYINPKTHSGRSPASEASRKFFAMTPLRLA